MAEVIDVPVPGPRNDYGKVQVVTENAFNALIATAKTEGLELAPVMGLMYLPDQAVTRQFEKAVRAVVRLLRVQA